MKHKIYGWLGGVILFLAVAGCDQKSEMQDTALDMDTFGNLLDVTHTPFSLSRRTQPFYTDMGAWLGYGIHTDELKSGFCGPFDLDSRKWLSDVLVEIVLDSTLHEEPLLRDSSVYYPDRLWMRSTARAAVVEQTLRVVSRTETLLQIESKGISGSWITGVLDGTEWQQDGNSIWNRTCMGEVIALSFPQTMQVELLGDRYRAGLSGEQHYVVISHHWEGDGSRSAALRRAEEIAATGDDVAQQQALRWQGYLAPNVEKNRTADEHRVMVKSVMTLLSNWRSAKGGLPHDGVVPSHVADYFVGFWAWDSWKHAVALAHIDIELAKEQVRAMFAFQDSAGMVIDCIYRDPAENNARDSKPPLASWAVNEIYEVEQDPAFVEEMYDKLLKYYQWWYRYRDHDQNGFCEYGSTDGTLEASKWESGMDNAIRFDDAGMLHNGTDAWSMDQESVELYAYLVLEADYIQKFATLLGREFTPMGAGRDLSRHSTTGIRDISLTGGSAGSSSIILARRAGRLYGRGWQIRNRQNQCTA